MWNLLCSTCFDRGRGAYNFGEKEGYPETRSTAAARHARLGYSPLHTPRHCWLLVFVRSWPGGADVRARAHATHTTAHNTSFYVLAMGRPARAGPRDAKLVEATSIMSGGDVTSSAQKPKA